MEKRIRTLAIESSCDETSVAIVDNGREVLANVISSQINIHKEYGGVVPEIASRHHLENINDVVDEAMLQAGVEWADVDLIGVTNRPGLVGALLIGVATAKAFAFTQKKPLIGVHHIEGHIFANFINNRELEPPFMSLVISGGHTSLIDVMGYDKFKVMGSTRDDAAGEAYDKVARVLGLGYPGGPQIDGLAKKGNPSAINFKRVYLEKGSLDFSFSGTKTGVMNYLHNQRQKGEQIIEADVAASFQEAILEVVVKKTMTAMSMVGRETLVVAGGVAANSRLRTLLEEACNSKGYKLYIPPLTLCTDNAAMIGCAAYYRYIGGQIDDLSLDAVANIGLE